MPLLKTIANLVHEPPPAYAFELSEAGIAWAKAAKGGPQIGFQPIEPDVLSVSPLKDNILRPDALAEKIRVISTNGDSRKRRGAAVILPDYCGRVAVLDFDSFPADPAEQLSLVRFRVKKTVPFDAESAGISFHAQSIGSGDHKRVEVVAAVVALEILARYEAVFRAAKLHPGYVTTSALAAMDLVHAGGVAVAVKLSGRVLTISIIDGKILKLLRCVELGDVSPDEMMAVLFPTCAYIEDEMKTKPQRMLLCGFGAMAAQLGPPWEAELGVTVEPLRSRFGAPDQYNAGLLGYLEAVG